MIEFTQFTMKFTISPVQLMKAYQWGEQPKAHPGLIKLNTNESPYPPHPSLSKKLANFDISNLRLYPDPRCDKLKIEVSKYFKMPTDMITLGNGSDELIALIFRVFLTRRDNALFTEHTYSHYKTYAHAAGINYSTMPMKNFQIDLNLLSRIQCKLFFLTNPNSPTGIAIEPKEIEYYLKKHQNKLFVIDEAYVDFADKKSCLPLIKEYNNILLLKTLSKSFSLCGIRLGFVLGHSDLIESINKVKDPYNVNALTQLIGVEVFKKAPYYQKNIEKIKKTRDFFSKQLIRLGFNVFPSSANFVFVLPPSSITAETIFYSLKKKRIYIRHFLNVKDHLRITIGNDEEMRKVIKELKTILD